MESDQARARSDTTNSGSWRYSTSLPGVVLGSERGLADAEDSGRVSTSASPWPTAWLLVLGYAGHGLKDYWQHRPQYVVNTRWWPPFCAAADRLVALVLIAEIIAGVNLHQ